MMVAFHTVSSFNTCHSFSMLFFIEIIAKLLNMEGKFHPNIDETWSVAPVLKLIFENRAEIEMVVERMDEICTQNDEVRKEDTFVKMQSELNSVVDELYHQEEKF